MRSQDTESPSLVDSVGCILYVLAIQRHGINVHRRSQQLENVFANSKWRRPWNPRTTPLTIGKDVLELLTTSMYVDPMTLYREYIQNAADGIDEARALGILRPHTAGVVDISIDATTRTVR